MRSQSFGTLCPYLPDIMPRLVRRRPLGERIKSYLNPLDFLLWLSEEIDANDWDQFEKDWALPLGISLNIIFIIARANSRTNSSKAVDDVFGDEGSAPWSSWLVRFRQYPAGSSLDAKVLIVPALGVLYCPLTCLLRGVQCFLHVPPETALSHVRVLD